MEVRNNKLLLFNASMLLNKREVLESFDDFVEYHREKDNESGNSEGKRKVLLALCEAFRIELEKCNIPALSRPWLFYEYEITQDSIELALYKCEDIEFDDDEMSSMTSRKEYTLAEVKCDYLTVEQYAELYDVTTTTVRQWIRRGKLRTAKKSGREWLIPALADKPRRGFDRVTYEWETLPQDIISAFPFLDKARCVHLFQNDVDKKMFYAITNWPRDDNRERVDLTAKERERLEIMLIAAPEVKVQDTSAGIKYVPGKRNFRLPILSCCEDPAKELIFPFDDIIVQQDCSNRIHFSPSNEPRDNSNYDYTSTYLIPFYWTFWGVPYDADDIFCDALDNGNYNDCTKIGTLAGHLILCNQMIRAGYDPLTVCDDESADLEYVMSALTDEGGPLNEWTGEPSLDVLYIDELIIEEPLRQQELGSRILQEVPFLCRELLHVLPDIISYYPAPTQRGWRQESEREVALRSIAMDRVAKATLPDDVQHEGNISNVFADRYRFSDDEIKMIMGRRHSGSSYPEALKNERLISFYQKNGLQELGDTRLLYAYTEM